jgi:hydroxymethylbilane synthase
MELKKIIIGSRDSKLAIAQTQLVMKEIHKYNPQLHLEMVTMKTTGDMILDTSLDKIGGKGLFVKELDKALIDGWCHIAGYANGRKP